MIYIFDRGSFSNEVAAIYANPLQADQSRLSILNLVFAVGLQLTKTSATHSFRENEILKRLDGGNIDRVETFYLNATHFNDGLSGFEDGDITSVQGLLLITVFMLTVAKRNAAWAYLGLFHPLRIITMSNQVQEWQLDLHMPLACIESRLLLLSPYLSSVSGE